VEYPAKKYGGTGICPSREKEEKKGDFQQKNQYYSLFSQLFYQLAESALNSTVFIEKRCKLRYD